MSRSSKQITFNLPFFCGYFLFAISDLLHTIPFIQSHKNLLVIAGGILISSKIIFSFFSKKLYLKKGFYCLLPVVLLSLISYFITRNFTILRFLLVIIGALTLDFHHFLKTDFYFRLALVAFAAIFALMGLTVVTPIYRAGGVLRPSFGFAHPNTFGTQILIIILEAIFLFPRHKLCLSLASLASSIFLYLVPNSRTSSVLIILGLLLYLFQKPFAKLLSHKISHFLVTGTFVILSGISFALAFIGGSSTPFAQTVNHLTSGRPALYHTILHYQGPSFFGSSDNSLDDNLPLDNSYLRLLVSFGLIQYLIFAILSIKTFQYLFAHQCYDLISPLLILHLYGLMESSFVFIQRDSFLASFNLPLRQPLKLESGVPNES